MHNRYIEYKYKDLVNNPFKYGLKEKDLDFTGINNQITGLQTIAINYLKNIGTIEEELMKLQTKLKSVETQKIIAGKSYYWKSKVNVWKQKKTETGIKLLTGSKVLPRLPVLLAQIKTGNDSYKLKNEIRQIVYLLINIISLM